MAKEKKHYKGYSIDKRGEAYRLRISYKGKSHTFTYHPPANLTESKQYAAAEKEAIRQRDLIQAGYITTIPTFEAYANYVIETKRQAKKKRATVKQYGYLLTRLVDEFGNDTLDRITPQRLNRFYAKLAESETFSPASALAKSNLLETYIKEKNISYKYICETGKIGKNTISLAIHGSRISCKTAEKICNVLNLDINDYFYIIVNAKPLSSKTIHEHIRLINTILNTALKERLIDFNPVKASEIPDCKQKPVNYYQPDEVAQIWKQLDNEPLRWRVICTLLIVTGCRRGEVAGLKWSAFLWEHNLIRINHEVLFDDEGIYTEDSTKTVDEKYVQIDPETKELVLEYKRQFESDMITLNIPRNDWPEYCFYQLKNLSKPIHPSSINNYFDRFSKKYGFRKINPHSLRHSLASALIADGVDTSAVSSQLGHKQKSTTLEIYGHQIREHQAKVAARIPQIYKRETVEEP